jgi:predicted dehydrogenase
MNVALIGAGYWGKIYLKTLAKISNVNLVEVYTYDYKIMLQQDYIDCVIIATPRETHFEITKDCLLANKHVLVEKPFTDNSEKALELFELSKKVNRILLVDHIYLHHPGIIKLKELVDNGYFGDINIFFSRRMSISNNQNALWEMGTHDIYILDYIFGNNNIEKIEAFGRNDHCYFIIKYCKKFCAVVEVNSHYPIKTRQITIEGTKKIAVLDDEIKNRLITMDYENLNVSQILEINNVITPLEKQCRHFFDCILDGNKPISDGYEGYKNIQILEKINKLLL